MRVCVARMQFFAARLRLNLFRDSDVAGPSCTSSFVPVARLWTAIRFNRYVTVQPLQKASLFYELMRVRRETARLSVCQLVEWSFCRMAFQVWEALDLRGVARPKHM